MSKCETCGRPDEGHWIGCAEVSKINNVPLAPAEPMDPSEILGIGAGILCVFPGCTAEQRSADKRVKYCDVHSDPKNRK